MSDEPVANGAGFTQKEMLVRIDAKVDVIAAKQTNYDVEQAILKAQVARNSEVLKHIENSTRQYEDKLEVALQERNDKVDAMFGQARQDLFDISKKIAWATGIIVGASVLFQIASALDIIHFSN